MQFFPASLQNLSDQFARLPGIGGKTAQRLAFHVLEMPLEEAQAFADAILEAKRTVHTCPCCQNLTDQPLCPICADETRDHGTICVVAEPKDVIAMERSREYRGVYHVLHGVISPLKPGDSGRYQDPGADAAHWRGETCRRSLWPRTPIPRARPRPCTFPGCCALWASRSPALPTAFPWAASWNMPTKSPCPAAGGPAGDVNDKPRVFADLGLTA